MQEQITNLIYRRKQILLFAAAGAVCALIELVTFKFFSGVIPRFFTREADFHGLNYPLSNIFSTMCGIISNYWLSIWFVFERGKHSKRREFAYFMGISVLSTCVSLLLFQLFFRYLFKENLGVGAFTLSPKVLSKMAAIVTVSVLNYSVKKRIIFNG